MKASFIFLFICLATLVSKGQGTLSSVVPNSAYPGQALDVTVRGLGTHFQNNVSVIDFGPSVEVVKFNVQNNEVGIASIKINGNASLGFVTVKVTTGSEALELHGGFEIFQAGNNVRGVLELTPIQTLYLSDFDPTNITNNPIIYNITVFNDAVPRPVMLLTVYLSTAGKGRVGKMSKSLSNIPANGVTKATNRDFNKFELLGYPGQELFYKVRETGIFPPDNYTYKLEITDENGNLLASDEVTTVLTNPVYNPELISPGNNFNRPPELVYISYPLFQWFGQADKFDFALYKAMNGQPPEETVRNVAVFKQAGVKGNNFLYPAYAEKLIDGTSYAWQVKSVVFGSKGEQQFPSEIFWFTYKSPQTAPAIMEDVKAPVKLSIQPQELTLAPGANYQFTTLGFDVNGMSVPVSKMQWRIAPNQGTIDGNGFFTAPSKPVTVAVIVKSGDLEDFATVIVKPAPAMADQWMVDGMLKQLFGLPK